MQRSRLNATRGMADRQEDPQVKAALDRLFTNIEPAIDKLGTFTEAERCREITGWPAPSSPAT